MIIRTQQGRFLLEIDPDTGLILSDEIDGFRSPDTRKKSGLRLTDAVTGIEYPAALPVEEKEGTFRQNGVIDGVGAEILYTPTDTGLYISGTLHNQRQEDRLLCVSFRVPVLSKGLRWLDDAEESRPIRDCEIFSNATPMVPGQKDQMVSLYPFGGVSNGTQTLAMAIPLDPPSSFEISYEAWNRIGYLVITVRMVLTPKTSLLPNTGSFSMAVYAPEEPEWGFRAVTKGYYDRFPQYYEKRIEGGNWLFQHNYYDLKDLDDYYFRYNETPGDFKKDWENHVVPLRYTAPGEVWMRWEERPRDPHPTYEEFMERFAELQRSDGSVPNPDFYGISDREFAEAVANSAVHTKEHKYLTMGWHAYGPTVAFFTNHSPSIPGWNLYRLQECQVKEFTDRAEQEGTRLGGVYIDNLSWGYDIPYNYRIDHFQYSAYTLLWDDGKELVWPNHFAQYEYARRIREETLANGQILLANTVFPEKGAVHYVHLVDVPGSEVGPRWGHDLWIQRLRRTLAYRKPWALLLTSDFPYMGEIDDLYAAKEQVMKDALLYGLFANVIGYRVPMEEYEAVRPLFKKYVPAMRRADRLGWEPVTHARAEQPGLLTERFGDMSQNEVLFTVMNTTGEPMQGSLLVDCAALGLSAERAAELTVTDMLGETPAAVTAQGDQLRITMTVAAGAAAALLLK